MVRKSLSMLGLALILALSFAMPVMAHDGEGEAMPASVYVVHGIPGTDLGLDAELPVDISVNGACALQAFPFGEIAGPVSLPAGEYDIAISLANTEKPCANDAVLQATVPFEAGESASVVAHLNEEGAPTASKFTNNLDHLRPYRLRVIAHHTANAPEVDVRFIRQELVDGRLSSRRLHEVTNGMQGFVDMRTGTWDISFRAFGDPRMEVGPFTVSLDTPNTIYLAFAVGSLENETFTVLLKQIQ
jgi:hypothetical protein